MYFRGDPDGLGPLEPMTQDEMESEYWAMGLEAPARLADLYLDFMQVDWLTEGHYQAAEEFHSHFCAAIFLARSVTTATADAVTALETEQARGEHRVLGWEYESDIVQEQHLNVMNAACMIASASAVTTAVVALEALLNGLLPDPKRHRGLNAKFTAFMQYVGYDEQDLDKGELSWAVQQLSHLRHHRNVFSHELLRPSDRSGDADTEGTAEFVEVSLSLQSVGKVAIQILLAERKRRTPPPTLGSTSG